MIKVMIVDDRPIFRKYLKTSIDWKKYGFVICTEAKNGVEALKKAKETLPDVLLTDINMPLMSGLELSEKIMDDYPDVGVILITAHSEFEYARQALKLGVCNYIVKPFEKEELILTLLKLKDNINKVNEEDLENENKERVFLELLLQQLIYRDQGQNNEAIEEQFQQLGISFETRLFMTSVITIENHHKIDGDNYIWKDTIINLIQQMFDSSQNWFVFSDYEGRIIILSEIEKNKEMKNLEGDLNKLLRLINKHLGFDVTIGVGRDYYNFDGIRKSYLEGISAIRYNFEVGPNKIIHYNTISNRSKKYVFYSAETNELILKHLRNEEISSIKKVLTSAYTNLKKEKITHDFTDMIYKGLMSLLFSYMYQSGLEIQEVFKNREEVIEKLKEKDLNKQLQILIDFYEKTIIFYNQIKNTRSYSLTKGAKQYVRENYHRHDLTVKDVAKAQYINETYMRRIFKKETEMTVNEYITEVRLEKTKELLRKTEYRLADIANMVGYNDSSYLSKIFKKNIGISPSKYRNNCVIDSKF